MKKATKRVSKALLAIILAACMLSQTFAAYAADTNKISVGSEKKTQIIVKYKNETKSSTVISDAEKKHPSANIKKEKKLDRIKADIWSVAGSANLDVILDELNKDPNVEYAQENYLLSTSTLPTDTRFAEQWGLDNSGQTVGGQTGTTGIDINAEDAWGVTQGASSVLVGVLDTGIDTSHSDLQGSIYVNANEIAGNGIDDDGNGYIDDVSGWDFVNGDNSVFDSSASDTHGTQMAGIIAAEANGTGIVGAAPDVTLLPLKFISGSEGYTSDAIEAIAYAKSLGVQVINCSFAGSDYNPALKDAMEESGILFICSAGNDGAELESAPVYPAAFDLPNKLSVASIDNRGNLAGFSNYGNYVDLAAPGVGILTTIPNSSFQSISGTSASAAFVTGIAALVTSQYPDMTAVQLATRIRSNVTKLTSLVGQVWSDGMADAYLSLTGNAQEISPPPIANTNPGAVGNSPLETQTAGVSSELLEQLHFGEKGVNPATGNYSRTDTDLSMSTLGFSLNISRTYNSKNNKDTLLGRGWTFGFEGKVEDKGSDIFAVNLPNGSAMSFHKEADDSYTALDSRCTLVKQIDDTYILTTKDQYTYQFDSNGWLTGMSDRNGNAITITRDGTTPKKITAITDELGRQFTLQYNANDQIETVTGPESRVITYAYQDGLLTQVTDPMGNMSSYEYNDAGYLSAVKDNEGNTLEALEYNLQFYVFGGSSNISRSYDFNTDTWSELAPMPTATTYLSSTSALIGSKIYVIGGYYSGYSSANQIYNTKDGSWSTGTSMPTARRYLSTIDVAGIVYAIGGYNGSYLSTVQTFDPSANTWMTKTSMPYALYGMATAAYGKNIYVCGGYNGSYRNYLQIYNTSTNTWTTGTSMPTTRRFATAATVDGIIYVIGGYNGSYLSTVQAYNPSTGTWATKTSMPTARYGASSVVINGKIYVMGGDNGSALTTVEIYDPDSNSWTTGTSLPEGRYCSTAAAEDGRVSSFTDEFGNTYDYSYDETNLTTTITDGNDNEIVKEYDASYYITSSTDPLEDTTSVVYSTDELGTNIYGEEIETTDRNGNVTQYIRDGNGNITMIINPDESFREYTYDDKNNLTLETDELGNSTYYIYDENQINLLKTIKPINGTDEYTGTVGQNFVAATYSYYSPAEAAQMGCDAAGLLRSVTDENGNTTSYEYDQYGYVSEQHNPDGGTEYKAYNQYGQVVQEISAQGYETDYTYDDNGNLEKKVLEDGSVYRTVYDGEGRVIKSISPNEYNPAQDGLNTSPSTHTYSGDVGTRYTYYTGGKIHTMTDACENTTIYFYDLYGNLTAEIKENGSISFYEYDEINRLSEKGFAEYGLPYAVTLEEYAYAILEDGSTQTTRKRYTSVSEYTQTIYTYDYAGRLISTEKADGSVLTNEYYANGQLYCTTDGNSGRTCYVYNGLGQLTGPVVRSSD